MSIPKPVLTRDPNAKVTWLITGAILAMATFLLLLLPIINTVHDTHARDAYYTDLVSRITADVGAQPIYDHTVTYYRHATDIGGTGSSATDHYLVYAGKYTETLPNLVRRLDADGFTCNGFVDKDGNSTNGDPDQPAPPTNLDYVNLTTSPGPFDPAIIAICNPDRLMNDPIYTFYNASSDGKPATVVYLER